MTAVDAVIGASGLAPERHGRRTSARVLICDERPATRAALANTVRASAWATDIVCVTDGFELADEYASRPADLVLIGHQAGRVDGVRATELLLSLHPSAAVIGFGPGDAGGQLAVAIDRGARGLMLWEPTQRPTPRAGLGGYAIPAPGWVRPAGPPTAVRLTDRELQVLQGMSQGRSNAEIGRSLFLSEDTIKTHARRLFNKIGARDRAHAVALGMRQGLVQ